MQLSEAVTVVHYNQICKRSLLSSKQFMLGDGEGKWFVVCDGMLLGRYVDRDDALEHARSIG